MKVLILGATGGTGRLTASSQVVLRLARLLRYGRISNSPSLTVFFGQAVDAGLAEELEKNRPIDSDSR